jgi:hypothetical protein
LSEQITSTKNEKKRKYSEFAKDNLELKAQNEELKAQLDDQNRELDKFRD